MLRSPQCNHQKPINTLNRGIIPLVQRPQGEISALITLLKTAAVMSVSVRLCMHACMHTCVSECVSLYNKITNLELEVFCLCSCL